MIEAANAAKTATLRLVSKTEQAEAYQLFGYLPAGITANRTTSRFC